MIAVRCQAKKQTPAYLVKQAGVYLRLFLFAATCARRGFTPYEQVDYKADKAEEEYYDSPKHGICASAFCVFHRPNNKPDVDDKTH